LGIVLMCSKTLADVSTSSVVRSGDKDIQPRQRGALAGAVHRNLVGGFMLGELTWNRCEGVMTAPGSLSFLGREVWPAVSLSLPTGQFARTGTHRMAQIGSVIGGARAKLKAAGLPREDAQRLLGPIDALVSDPRFLERGQEALAVSLAPNVFHKLRLRSLYPLSPWSGGTSMFDRPCHV
jgi:hypothetical protein